MQHPIQRRLTQLRERLAKQEYDTILVVEQANRRYLSGFTAEDGQCDESAGVLFITPERLILATDSRYDTQARAEAPEFEVFCYKKGLAHSLPQILTDLRTKCLGFESVRLSYLQHQRCCEQLQEQKVSVSWVPTEGVVEDLRMVKDAAEIMAIKRSLVLAETAFQACLAGLSPGMTEKELAWALEKGLREGGAESVAFTPIVASGPNAALPHAIPSERRIMPGEPVLFDWGARLNGYCSDISRTVVLGASDDTFRSVFQVVRDAQAMATDAIKPGVSTMDVDKVARDHIAAKGFGDYFGHGLGHGVGLATHEKPHLSPLRPMRMEAGMVTTVEPGIYLPDWGGVRLENMVLVTEKGAEVLNTLDVTPGAIP